MNLIKNFFKSFNSDLKISFKLHTTAKCSKGVNSIRNS